MPVAVSLINMKGGVGKTTLAFNLAWFAAHSCAKKVLVVDLDPQANASQYLMGAVDYLAHIKANKPTIVNILEQFTPAFHGSGSPTPAAGTGSIVPVREWGDGSLIHLVPSRLELAWTLKNPTSKDHLLAKFIADHGQQYDLVIIDCAPTESILTVAAYKSSRYILIPVKPEFLAAIGLPLLVRSIQDFHSSYGQHQLDIAGIVFTDSDPQHVKPEHLAGRNDVKAVAQQNGWPVFTKELRHSDSYPRGARDGSAIFHTDYARWWVVDEFKSLGSEFMKSVGL